MQKKMKIKEIIWIFFDKNPLAKLIYLNGKFIFKKPFLKILYRNLKKEPTLENININTKYFAKVYNLGQTDYFVKIGEYGQDNDFKKKVGNKDNYLPLWHFAALDFLRNNLSKDAEILDICCGMGHFFIFLKELGFSKFTGIDDSIFQPGIIKAAKDFLGHYKIKNELYDFNVSYIENYKKLKEKSFEVITHFGVGTYNLFSIVFHLLRNGGYFILETIEEDAGVWKDKFEVVKLYEGYGRIPLCGHKHNTIIFKKI